MSNFDKINNMWVDLETAYQKIAAKKSSTRMDFAKQLVNYSKGDAGKRALLKLIHKEGSDAGVDSDVIETLCNKVEMMVKNIEKFSEGGHEPGDMTEFLQDCEIVFNVWDYSCIDVNTRLVSLDDAIKSGILFQTESINPDGTFELTAVDGIKYSCMNQAQLITLVKHLKDLYGTPESDDDTLYAIGTLIKENLQTPLLLMNSAVAEKITKGFDTTMKSSEIVSATTKMGKDISYHSIQTPYGEVYLLNVG